LGRVIGLIVAHLIDSCVEIRFILGVVVNLATLAVQTVATTAERHASRLINHVAPVHVGNTAVRGGALGLRVEFTGFKFSPHEKFSTEASWSVLADIFLESDAIWAWAPLIATLVDCSAYIDHAS